jgi:hypothetical protein
MTAPLALTSSEQLKSLMTAARSVPRRHRDWFVRTITAELPFAYNLPEAINRALARLQQHESAE